MESTYPTDDKLYRMVKEGMEGTLGFPVGVQVIGRPWQEEMILGVMELLHNLRDNKKLFQRNMISNLTVSVG